MKFKMMSPSELENHLRVTIIHEIFEANPSFSAK